MLISKTNNKISMIDELPPSDKIIKMNHMLIGLFPDDDISNDSPTASLIRNHQFSFNNNVKTVLSIEELNVHIKKLNHKKAPGLDYISNRMIKASADLLSSHILAIFNKCIDLHYFPDIWKTATVRVLAKPNKSDYNNIKSYRPI
ncbi:hypothetical protein BLA29_010700, partial [Euroglyphus maynei]